MAGVASGQIKIEVRPDGYKVISNEKPVQRKRRLSNHLVPVPQSELEGLIREHARNQHLEPRLVRAVVQVESGYNPRARSNKGAMGLMQLMPATAEELGVESPYDPAQNLRGGTVYLRRLLNIFSGRLELALASYNAGPQAVRRFGGVPPYAETRDYVQRVIRLYRGDDKFVLPKGTGKIGRKTYIVRDAQDRLVLTTTPPRPR